MRVDFYQLSRDPVEVALPLLARATLKAGERMLVVSSDDAQLGRIGVGLWAVSDSFLANGRAGGAHDERQPVLLSDRLEPANGARFLALADGTWREEATNFARTFLLFDDRTVEGARGVWRQLRGREGTERHFWKQDGGRWIEAA
ncbi:DNA polymerase III subunit chi [Novosphingobium sp. 9U]|uniref:DNA polymerase III subunit chi n=1 Tax=Novosphingobium sp. 9U TaxID=2653158 RepID=UPI0012F1B412|nr:DNA polymerase III subunit chi [Novosphingobium sp. 9U]VWX52161.1 DNA polymerase III chi subunit [Novosphingobium sp. 9U]